MKFAVRIRYFDFPNLKYVDEQIVLFNSFRGLHSSPQSIITPATPPFTGRLLAISSSEPRFQFFPTASKYRAKLVRTHGCLSLIHI